ncbi:uncharacterized protein B0I36DRAFT_408590 [Microdochium trichocladiopsis]|uniref:Cyclase n=1 Tax=Microdochium trichocladiopsis TaxID=1682393 RepID=A0A9P8Y590_9PEZI|nr:uncharacterized protein B0I36DRAFT_408590 [Microdochium trichocladiopsis]KAH7030581.1 hypothetical protein B0I36DRAFT_408590 [Microdochium trichocladiopsis]
MPRPSHIPRLEELPLRPDNPPNSAWGLWGEDDKLGSLNYLTDQVVLSTIREEVRTGERVGLDLPLDHFDPPLLGRAGHTQQVINKEPLVVNDDVITFNTQCSSQWDSLRHFAYQKDKKFYNGTTQADIHCSPRTDLNSLQPWTEKGIAGRGVLIDYASWAHQQGRPSSQYCFQGFGIPIGEVKELVSDLKLDLRPGDVLFLRTGYVQAYGALTEEGRKDVAQKREWIGLAQSRETTEWLWDNQFAAVVSDSPGFECRPPIEPAWHLHPILLAGWGTPIGELFDLDRLAALCEKHQKWSFFFTSAPLNYQGAVASPPNAIAIL